MVTITTVSGSRPSAEARQATAARRWPPALICGGVLLAILAVIAIAASAFGSPYHQNLTSGLTQSGTPLPFGSPSYPLGTDLLGRSELALLAFGARASLAVALAANLISLVIGTAVGIVAGYYRGPASMFCQRLIDVGLALPATLAALVLATLMSSGVLRVIVIISALFWAYPARIIYGEVLRLRSRGFVEAAQASGLRRSAIVRKHILPHLGFVLLTYVPLNAAAAVLFEATLSYLGAGVNPPTPSWGNMIADGQTAISYAPHMLIEPAIMVLITALGFLLVGEGLKARNPELRQASWLGG